MGKYSHILLCSDLDGTLLDSRGELSAENIDAIERFCAEGGKFCISTGRLPSHLLQFVDKDFFNCPIICSNGAAIYDFSCDKVLYERTLGEKMGEVAEFIAQNCAHILESTFFVNLEKFIYKGFGESIEQIREVIKNPAYKLVMHMDTPENTIRLRDMLRERFSEYFNFARSWNTGLEVLNKYATKGDTVRVLKKILGGDYISVCVGDYENDITMVEKADFGCAVANAVPELKAVADRTICSNDEHAIKYIVENICGELKKEA